MSVCTCKNCGCHFANLETAACPGCYAAAVQYAERLTPQSNSYAVCQLNDHTQGTDCPKAEAMRCALERAKGCIKGLLARTPVRDVAETLAEIDAALEFDTNEVPTLAAEGEGR